MKMKIKYMMWAILIIGWILGGPHEVSTASSGEQPMMPQATEGVLDLSKAEPTRSGWSMLNGQWKFYWNAFLEPDELNAPGLSTLESSPQYVHVPSIWSSYIVNGHTLPNQGYATYRLVVKLNEGDVGTTQELYVPSVATAYKLWVDGKLLGGRGTLGTSRDEMVPKNVPSVYSFKPSGDKVEIVIQVSNFVQRKGGLWEELRMGDSEAITQWRNRTIIMEVVVFGSIMIMAVYHLGLYAYRRKDKSPLFFGGLCLAVSLRIAVLGQTLAVYLVPSLPWEAAVKIEYLSAIVGLYLVLLFTQSQYPGESHRNVQHISLAVNGIMAGIVLATPASLYTELFVPYVLVGALPTVLYVTYVYMMAAFRRRQGSLLNGIGFVFFSLTIANDVLFYTQWVNEGNFIPLGLLGFLFTQSLNLAGRFSYSFKQTESLSEQLQQMNESLEHKVEERTVELKDAFGSLELRNRELHRMEQSRRQLLSTISHELGTPLTSIQGYVKLMLDGVIRNNEPRTLQLIYDKSLYLDRIIQDLFELSKLEAMQIRFHFQDIAVASLLGKVAQGHVWNSGEWAGQSVNVVMENWKPEDREEIATLHIDPIRIEQVVANFVSNAKKYTPPDGMIRISISESTMPGTGEPAVRVEVTDTGIGIAAEELANVFERFYKGKSSLNARLEGAGLGLAISKQIIEQHNGHIGVESEPDRGSSFYFILPIRWQSRDDKEKGEAV